MTTLREHLSQLGRKGGKATAKNRTPEQRQAAAIKAIQARWAKQRDRVDEIAEGTKALLKRSKAAAASQKKRKAAE